MNPRRPRRAGRLLIAASLSGAFAGSPSVAGAPEAGQSHADFGYIDTLAGLPLAPGLYLRDDVAVVTTGQSNNGAGDPVRLNLGRGRSLDLKVRSTATADIASFAYVPDFRIPYLDASVGIAAYEFAAVAHSGVTSRLGVPQASGETVGGLGDVTVVPVFFGFDVPKTDFHFILAPFDFTAPTGRYSATSPASNNLGLNYWSYRPALEFTYLNQTGQEFDLNISASFNSQNQATRYKSGDEFYLGYAFQQYLSPMLAFGIGGYWYKQTSSDTQNGQTVDTNTSLATFDLTGAGPGDKGETFAIGPIVSYNLSHDVVFQAHWDHELYSYNRAQRDLIYVRAVFHF